MFQYHHFVDISTNSIKVDVQGGDYNPPISSVRPYFRDFSSRQSDLIVTPYTLKRQRVRKLAHA